MGSFIVKYASGNTWYGYDYFFGPNTSYSKADEIFEFKRTISRSAQSRLFDLQRRLSIADADFRSFLIARGMSEKQSEYIFNGVNSDTGETGIDRLPSSYWKQFLSQIKNISLHNEIVDRLNSRNQISNQLIRLRNEEESIEGYTITLYKVRDGNLRTSEIDAEDF